MLELKNIDFKIDKKVILNDFSINIAEGEVHAIMGPNGTGKSTLSKIIMGHPEYRPDKGTIRYKDEDIAGLTPDEISKRGIFLSMQHPISIEGVSNSEFLRTALNSRQEEPVAIFNFIKKIEASTENLEMDKDVLHQSINEGASGGERKRNEVLQIKMLEPEFIILDELDSGLDIDSLRIVCDNLNKYKEENPKTSFLIITHYPRILNYLKPDYVHILDRGKIRKTGSFELAQEIEESGYTNLEENNG